VVLLWNVRLDVRPGIDTGRGLYPDNTPVLLFGGSDWTTLLPDFPLSLSSPVFLSYHLLGPGGPRERSTLMW
jgi:hypothetical protein